MYPTLGKERETPILKNEKELSYLIHRNLTLGLHRFIVIFTFL